MALLAQGEELTTGFGQRYKASNDLTVFLAGEVRATAQVFDGHAVLDIAHEGGHISFLLPAGYLGNLSTLIANAVDSALDILPTSPTGR